MEPKLRFVSSELSQIKKNNLYRRLRPGTVSGAHITINGQKLLNLCSNDYLAIRGPRITSDQMQSSSRLVSGNDESFYKLEKKLARHKSHRDSLVYPTGYMANLGTIQALVKKGDTVLSDSLNHSSIIEACKLSGGRVLVYEHNNLEDLGRKIKTKSKRKFIITEGIFSMDGDYARLKEIAEIAQKNSAVLIVDDAHGDFVVGSDGRGTANRLGVARKVDVYISSLSKGLGSFGGYVASDSEVIDLCTNKSKAFIYTSALPRMLVCHASKRMDGNREKQRLLLEKNTKHMQKKLRGMGYEIPSNTHIIPIIIGDEKKSMAFGRALIKDGVFAQPIRYPTVAKNSARIRLSVTAWPSQAQLDAALGAFESIGKKFKII